MASLLLVFGATLVLSILQQTAYTHHTKTHSGHAHSGHAHSGRAHSGYAHSRRAHSRHNHKDGVHSRRTHNRHVHNGQTHFVHLNPDPSDKDSSRDNRQHSPLQDHYRYHHYSDIGDHSDYTEYWDYDGDYDQPDSPAHYHLLHGACDGGQTLEGLTGLVTSPWGPGDVYPPNARCSWLLKAPVGRHIRLRASVFSIEQSTGCEYDHLQVYDGKNASAPSLARLCGSTFPAHGLNSTGPLMFLKFVSDKSVSKRGFRLLYSTWWQGSGSPAVAPSHTPTPSPTPDGSSPAPCGGQLSVTPGTFSSPNFGSNQTYPYSTTCQWLIDAGPDNVVKFDFETFDMEYSANCQFDSLSVYDGVNQTSRQLASWCGSHQPPALRTSGRHALVVFTSDSSVQDTGFMARYSTQPRPADQLSVPGCHSQARPAVLRGKEGVVKSPSAGPKGHYPDNTICQWRIHVADSKRAHVHFTIFSVEPDAACRYDHVAVYDGGDTTAPSLGRYCGHTLPGDITASTNQLLIEFQSDESVTAQGFSATYSAKAALGGPGNASREPACGVPSFPPKFARIVGGMEAVPYSWPWQVSVQYFDHHYCGGTVLARHWVLTAAHCMVSDGYVKDAEDFSVRVGEHDLKVFEGREQTVPVAEVIVHPNYDQRHTRNDIALLRLTRGLRYTRAVRPACLPRRDAPVDLMCVTTGWGLTQGTANPRKLNQVRVPLIDRALCSRPDWYYRKFTDAMICAGYAEGGKDSCQGDSGGPLVCRDGGMYRLHGVTSWGFGCARPKAPGIYTRVTRFIDWIDSHTNGSYQLPP